MHPVLGQHLNHPNPGEDTGGEGIQGADSDQRRGVVSVELFEDADANSHTDGGDERKDAAHNGLLEERDALLGKASNAGTKRDTLEHLVEEDDGEEGLEERVASNHKSETDQERVEDDASLEDPDTDLLLGVAVHVHMLVMVTGVHNTAVRRRQGTLRLVRCGRSADFLVVSWVVALAPDDEASAQPVDKEGNKDSCEEDGRSRSLVGESSKTLIGEHQLSMSEELYMSAKGKMQ